MARHIFLRQIYDNRDPTQYDDVQEGYQVGQPWINEQEEESFWICVNNSPSNAIWINFAEGVLRVDYYINYPADEYDNRIIYCETTEQVFYSNGQEWILLSWNILEVETYAEAPDLSDPINQRKYLKKLMWVKNTQTLFYCDGNSWIIVNPKYATGQGTFSISGTTIIHNLDIVPGYIGITPFGAGYPESIDDIDNVPGNIWITNITTTSFTVLCDNDISTEFLWLAIQDQSLLSTESILPGIDPPTIIDEPEDYYG